MRKVIIHFTATILFILWNSVAMQAQSGSAENNYTKAATRYEKGPIVEGFKALKQFSHLKPSDAAAGYNQSPPLPNSLVPLRIQNWGSGSLTVKLIGPTSKALRLSNSEYLVVLVSPGAYQCFYKFNSWSEQKFVFKKTAKFQVSAETVNKLNGTFEVSFDDQDVSPFASELREAKSSSAIEFGGAEPNAPSPDDLNTLRFRSLDLIVVIEDLVSDLYTEDDEKSIVTGRLNQYIRGVLIPKLSRQGFEVNYVGVRDKFDERNPTGPALVLRYKETDGMRYASDLGRSVTGYNIDCSLTLYHPGIFKGEGIWGATVNAANDESFKVDILRNPKEVLHNQALRYLRASLNDLELSLVDWALIKRAQNTQRSTRSRRRQ